jgi:hypothetical protein
VELAPRHAIRPTVRRPRTREAIPTSEHPNFRDHGRTVERPLLELLTNLQKKYGRAYASEDGIRHMICENMDHMPGVGTVRGALHRLERQGLIEQHWLYAGEILPDGKVSHSGTRVIIVPQCRRELRGMKARGRRADASTGRVQRRMQRTLAEVKRAAFRPTDPPPGARAAELEERKRVAIAQAEELGRVFHAEDAAKRRPPD